MITTLLGGLWAKTVKTAVRVGTLGALSGTRKIRVGTLGAPLLFVDFTRFYLWKTLTRREPIF